MDCSVATFIQEGMKVELHKDMSFEIEWTLPGRKIRNRQIALLCLCYDKSHELKEDDMKNQRTDMVFGLGSSIKNSMTTGA